MCISVITRVIHILNFYICGVKKDSNTVNVIIPQYIITPIVLTLVKLVRTKVVRYTVGLLNVHRVDTFLTNNGSAADNDITLIQDRCLSGCDGTLRFVEY